MNETILIIEDDEVIARFLKIALTAKGYSVRMASAGLEGLRKIGENHPDLLLLDLGLPDIDGVEVLRQIMASTPLPVIVVSARDKEREKVEALDLGAEDFLTKPFNVGELMARIRVVLRRKKDPEAPRFDFGDLSVDFERRRVTLRGEEIHLTPIEYSLLRVLIENKGKVLTHAFLQRKVWNYDSTDDYQSLRVFLASIRKKIEDDPTRPRYIVTEIGVGYRFRDEWIPADPRE